MGRATWTIGGRRVNPGPGHHDRTARTSLVGTDDRRFRSRIVAAVLLATSAFSSGIAPAVEGHAPAGVAAAQTRPAPRPNDASASSNGATDAPNDDSGAGQMAAMVAVLNRQGAEGAAIVSRVASIDVTNPLPIPGPTTDPGAAQTALANAAAASTAIAATEVARAVQATVEARATEEAAAATPATAAMPTESAAVAAVNADDDGTPPSLLGFGRLFLPREWPSSLVLALGSACAALLVVLLLRARREPFVLKAKPVRV